MRDYKHVVIFYMTSESEKMGVPSVVGPFDDQAEAIAYANKLRDHEYHWVKLGALHPPRDMRDPNRRLSDVK